MPPNRASAASPAATPDAWLEAFEDAWSAGATPRIEEHLPAGDANLRRSVLEELIRIDINWRWSAAGRGVAGVSLLSLENYCSQFPELGGLANVPDALIGEDYRAMNRWGSAPEHGSYLARFGDRAPQLKALLERIDAELAREFAASPRVGRPVAPMAIPVPGMPLLPVGEFVKQLRALALVEPGVLDPLLRQPKEAADAHTLARALIAGGSLTPYQVNSLLRGRGHELVVGQYVLLDRLGQGGMGKVFKAVHRGMRRLVALKVIHADLMLNEEVVNRFYREIRLVGQFSHRNIVHAYDAGPIGTAHALAMEFVDGTDLGRHVKKAGAMEVARACEYVRQAAEGLQYAFERGLVHRDMKPHNLLCVSSPGQPDVVKILDFGLARLQRIDSGLSSMVTPTKAAMIGTPDFLAPEQAVDFHSADTRADIYSLSCTLYYLLTAATPFPGGTMADKLLRHQMAEPPDLREKITVPAGLAELVKAQMAKRPADRLPTPGALAAALAPYTSFGSSLPPRLGEADTVVDERTPFIGVDPAPAIFVPEASPWPARSLKIVLALFAATVIGLLIAVALLVGPWMKSAKQPVTTKEPSARGLPDPARPGEDPFYRDLLGYWRMDEGHGTHAADASGRGNHGTLVQAAWTAGVRGRGVQFSGDDSFLSYGASPDFNFADNAPFTFAGWFKTIGVNGFLLSQRHHEKQAADIDVWLDAGQLCAIVRTDQRGGANLRATRPVNDGKWHHFALTRNRGDTVQLYLDGASENTVSLPGLGGAITTNLRALGSERLWVQINFGGQAQFRGAVDEFCILARELSAADIKELIRRTGSGRE